MEAISSRTSLDFSMANSSSALSWDFAGFFESFLSDEGGHLLELGLDLRCGWLAVPEREMVGEVDGSPGRLTELATCWRLL